MNKKLEEFEIYKTASSLVDDGLKKLLEKWQIISERRATSEGVPLLPNIFLECSNAFEIQEFVTNLGVFLSEQRIMDFDGKALSYYYVLDYSRSSKENSKDIETMESLTFPGFTHFYTVIKEQLTRFGKPYRGVLAIDITDWIEGRHYDEIKFHDFLAFMHDNDECTLAVFISKCRDASKNSDAFKEIAATSRLIRIKADHADVSLFLNQFKELIHEKGLELDKESEKVITETIVAVSENKYVDIHHFLSELSVDLAYNKFIDSADDKVIHGDEVDYYKKDGEFVSAYLSSGNYGYGFKGAR
ncbi:MAG: hypothetical protein K5694_03445 [Bacilli bacterium]|nr:hypothetical protein [Bacilli bacterium]